MARKQLFLKKQSFLFLAMLVTRVATAQVPNTINLQGRLTDANGNPVKTPTQVDFSIWQGGGPNTGDEGTVVYKERVIIGPGPNGEYTHLIGSGTPLEGHTLAPSDFLTDLPVFFQTMIAGAVLLPRLKLVSTPYSLVSESVVPGAVRAESVAPNSLTSNEIKDGTVQNIDLGDNAVTTAKIQDGAITQAKLDSGVSGILIPSGLIGMFAQSCPVGWQRFELLDNRFPMGVSTYSGNPAGSAAITGLTTELAGEHSHTVNPHTHSAGSLNAEPTSELECPLKSGGGHCHPRTNHQHTISGETGNSSPGTDTQGNHTHTITSDGSWRPPYLGLVFCQKD